MPAWPAAPAATAPRDTEGPRNREEKKAEGVRGLTWIPTSASVARLASPLMSGSVTRMRKYCAGAKLSSQRRGYAVTLH